MRNVCTRNEELKLKMSFNGELSQSNYLCSCNYSKLMAIRQTKERSFEKKVAIHGANETINEGKRPFFEYEKASRSYKNLNLALEKLSTAFIQFMILF